MATIFWMFGVSVVVETCWILLQSETVCVVSQRNWPPVVCSKEEPSCLGFQQVMGSNQGLLPAWWQLQSLELER